MSVNLAHLRKLNLKASLGKMETYRIYIQNPQITRTQQEGMRMKVEKQSKMPLKKETGARSVPHIHSKTHTSCSLRRKDYILEEEILNSKLSFSCASQKETI